MHETHRTFGRPRGVDGVPTTFGGQPRPGLRDDRPMRCAFLHRSGSGAFTGPTNVLIAEPRRTNTSGFPLPPSWNEGRRLGRRPSFCFPGPSDGSAVTYGTIGHMEIDLVRRLLRPAERTRGRRRRPTRTAPIVGPTGRGLTADIVTFSHAEDEASAPARGKAKDGARDHAISACPCRPASRPPSSLDSPGEYEVHDVMVTGVRTFRDAVRGAERGSEHGLRLRARRALTPRTWATSGTSCRRRRWARWATSTSSASAVGRALPAAPAAELVAQLGANLGRAAAGRDGRGEAASDLERFLKEMSVTTPAGAAAQRLDLDRPAGDRGRRPGAARPHLR